MDVTKKTEHEKICEMAKSLDTEQLQILLATISNDLLFSEVERRFKATFDTLEEVESILGIERNKEDCIERFREIISYMASQEEKILKLNKALGGK